MTPDQAPTQTHDAVSPEALLGMSEWARDAGDRTCCGVLAVAVVVMLVLVAGWVWAMPSFG